MSLFWNRRLGFLLVLAFFFTSILDLSAAAGALTFSDADPANGGPGRTRSVKPKTVVVSPEGGQFDSIAGAIDAANPGDTVTIEAGVYEENLTIDKDLTLKGSGVSAVKIEGVKEEVPVILVGPSKVEVTLEGLTLQGAEGDICEDEEKGVCPVGLSVVGEASVTLKGLALVKNALALMLLNSARAHVTDSDISGNEYAGIALRDATEVTVTDSEIVGGEDAGVVLVGSAVATLSGTKIMWNEGDALLLEDSAVVDVKDSEIMGSECHGILLSGTSRATVEGTKIGGNYDGGIALEDAAQATVTDCEIMWNQDVGIALEGSTKITIKDVEIRGNYYEGIALEGSAEVTIKNSFIWGNEAGIGLAETEDFDGTLAGYGNRIVDNETEFEGVTEEIQARLTGPANYRWSLGRIEAPKAWEISEGEGTVVAVISSGVEYDHPALQGRIWTNEDEVENGEDDDGNGYVDDLHGWDFADDDNSSIEGTPLDYGGTVMAGLIAGNETLNNGQVEVGVAPEAKIMDLRILAESGFEVELLVKALRYAIDKEADVIVLPVYVSANVESVRNIIKEAYDAGVTLVGIPGPHKPDVEYPGKYPEVICCTELSQDNSLTGTTDEEDPYVNENRGPEIDFAAPGMYTSIPMSSRYWEEYGIYAVSWSSKWAAAHVSGTVALMKAVDRSLSPARIKEILIETSEDLGAEGKDEEFGYGLINAYEAVKKAKGE